MKPSCGTCVFFSPAPNGGFRGQCRFHAPDLASINGQTRTAWPLVREHDWCGEHAVWDEEGDE